MPSFDKNYSQLHQFKCNQAYTVLKVTKIASIFSRRYAGWPFYIIKQEETSTSAFFSGFLFCPNDNGRTVTQLNLTIRNKDDPKKNKFSFSVFPLSHTKKINKPEIWVTRCYNVDDEVVIILNSSDPDLQNPAFK